MQQSLALIRRDLLVSLPFNIKFWSQVHDSVPSHELTKYTIRLGSEAGVYLTHSGTTFGPNQLGKAMNTKLPPGTKLPLVCTYRNSVAGNGFVAKVEMRGHMLAVVDDHGELWLHTVHPSGWAETGASIAEAHALFRNTYTGMLYDLAEDAANFREFRTAADGLNQCSPVLLESWKEAVDDMRPEWAEKLNLQIEPAGQMPYIKVTEVHSSQASPKNNQLDPALPAAVKPAA